MLPRRRKRPSLNTYSLASTTRLSIWPNRRPLNPYARRQLELLDHQIREIDHEIAAADNDQEELERLDSSLDAELAESFQVQEETESDYQELTGRRRQLRREYVEIEDRVAEIDTLLARFRLLEQHYGSDQDRLAALIEAGTLFALEDGEVCPGRRAGSSSSRTCLRWEC